MDWKYMEIQDKEIINSFLRSERMEASEMTYTNLFLWREGYDIEYRILNDMLCVRHKDPLNHPVILTPVGKGDLKATLLELSEEWHRRDYPFILTPIIYSDIAKVEKVLPGRFKVGTEPDHGDYIYSIDELINLRGKKFHDKKNMLNRFMRDNEFEYLPMSDNLLQKVAEAAEEWCEWRNCEEYAELENEKDGIYDCLKHFTQLDCKGAVIMVKDKVVAFTFGEPLNDDTVVIHIEKADQRMTGAYQIINQLFLKNEWSTYKWVNREGDMGLEGLRKAKMSYNPVQYLDKYSMEEILP